MTSIEAVGTLLTASRESRTLRYRLLPYNEPGRTNKGRVTAGPGSVTLPDAAVQVNREHDKKRPVGLLLAEAAPDGLDAVVQLTSTQEADDALAALEGGDLPGISVEIKDPVIRGGKLISGTLVGAGLVKEPAFDSALLTAAADDTPDAPDTPNQEGTKPAMTTTLDATQSAQLTDLLAALAGGTGNQPEPGPDTSLHGITSAMAASSRGELTAAALDVITKADVYDVVNVPQYVGELRKGRRYIPRYIPLFSSDTLTSASLSGWRYVDGKTPTVGDWDMGTTGTVPAEQPKDIPSSETKTELVTATASYLAGGGSIQRIHYDLPTPGFLESYFRESDDDFMRKLDAKVLANMMTPANQTAVTAAGADASTVWSKLILGAHHVLESDLPEWAVIGPDLWRAALNTTKLEALELLSAALGLEDGQLDKFRLIGAPVSATSLNGTVTVGSAATATLHTLPGGPTRVEAVNVQKGTVDNGVYGYWGIINHNPKALVKVS